MTEQVTDFDACVEALRQPDLRQSLYDEASLMMERSLVNLHGPEHRARRGAEAMMFRKDIFLDYERNVLPQVIDETLGPFFKDGQGDLVDLGYRVMLNLTVEHAKRPTNCSDCCVSSAWRPRSASLAPKMSPKKGRVSRRQSPIMSATS